MKKISSGSISMHTEKPGNKIKWETIPSSICNKCSTSVTSTNAQKSYSKFGNKTKSVESISLLLVLLKMSLRHLTWGIFL